MYYEEQNLSKGTYGCVIVVAEKDGDGWHYECEYLCENRTLSNSKMLWCKINGMDAELNN